MTPRRRALVLGAVALAVRLAHWAVVTPRWVPTSDADQYVELARALARGQGYVLQFPGVRVHPTAFRPPLLPVLLAPAAWLGGSALWPLRLVGALIGSAAAPLAAAVAARVRPGAIPDRAVWAAGLLVACSPQLVANDSVVLSDGLGVVLLLAGLVAALDRRPVLAGLAGGALLLTRPNAYLVVLVLAAVVAVRTVTGGAERRVALRRGLAVVGVAVAVVAPWIVRNGVQVGAWRPATSDGFNLAALYSPQAQAAGRFADPVFDPRFDDPAIRFTQLDEARWNATLWSLGWQGLTEHPGYVVTNVVRNGAAYLELDPGFNRPAEDADGRHWGFRTCVGRPWFYAVSALDAVGWWRHRRTLAAVAVAVLVAQFATVSLLLVAAPRLRAPVDALVCVGAGLAVGTGRRAAARRAASGAAEDASPAPIG